MPLTQRVSAMNLGPSVPRAEALLAVVKENVAMQVAIPINCMTLFFVLQVLFHLRSTISVKQTS